MKYVLFIKNNCPFCVKAREFLDENSLPYKEVLFDDDQTNILNEIKETCNWKTVPMIFYCANGQAKFIGGYTDLIKQINSDDQKE